LLNIMRMVSIFSLVCYLQFPDSWLEVNCLWLANPLRAYVFKSFSTVLASGSTDIGERCKGL